MSGAETLTDTVSETVTGTIAASPVTRKVALQGRNSRETLVRDIMTAQVLTVTPRTDIRAAMQLMSDRKIRHLPVVDDQQRLVGMVTQSDLVRALHRAVA